MALYALLGLLGLVALLAAAALILDRPSMRAPDAQVAAPADLPPPPAPLPALQPPPNATAGPGITPEQLNALQAQIREANATLLALRAEAERTRRDAAVADRPRAAPGPRQSTLSPPPSPAPAVTPPAMAPPAIAPPAVAPAAAPSDFDDAMSPPPKPPYPAQASAGPARQAEPPAAYPAARPRVFLHHRGGSAAGQQEANDIAQRLLFSDFAYVETRKTADSPAMASVRFFYPEDAAAAARLAGLLGGTGLDFQVQDFSARRGRASRGTLEVWLPG